VLIRIFLVEVLRMNLVTGLISIDRLFVGRPGGLGWILMRKEYGEGRMKVNYPAGLEIFPLNREGQMISESPSVRERLLFPRGGKCPDRDPI
tara:strand:+ start:38 stop:313 length:276 start_codon:yes stop_codon:yes gene_type:complete